MHAGRVISRGVSTSASLNAVAKLFCANVSAEAGGLHGARHCALGPGTSSNAAQSAAAAPGPADELQPASASPNSSPSAISQGPATNQAAPGTSLRGQAFLSNPPGNGFDWAWHDTQSKFGPPADTVLCLSFQFPPCQCQRLQRQARRNTSDEG